MIEGADVSPVLLNNAVADAQSEAGSLSYRLGGVERIEDAIHFTDARAAVVHSHESQRAFSSDVYLQRSTARVLKHRVDGIIDDVQEYLFKLMSVRDHGRH